MFGSKDKQPRFKRTSVVDGGKKRYKLAASFSPRNRRQLRCSTDKWKQRCRRAGVGSHLAETQRWTSTSQKRQKTEAFGGYFLKLHTHFPPHQ